MKSLKIIGFAALAAAMLMAVGCNIEPSHEHTFATEWSGDETYHWHECSCGEKSEKAEHTFGEWEIVAVATTTAPGSKKKTCTVCKKEITEEIPIIPENHVHSWDEGVVTKEAAAETDGEKTFTCATCGSTKTETIPALGTDTGTPDAEKPDDTPSQDTDTPSAENPEDNPSQGSGSSGSGDSGNTGSGTGSGSSGEGDSGSGDSGNTGSGTGSGSSGDGDSGNTGSGNNPSEETHTHDFSGAWIPGETTHWKECSCGAKSDEEDHDWDEGVVEKQPTCTTTGELKKNCTKCGKTNLETISATHTWGEEGEIITIATTRTPGEKQYTCTGCGATETRPYYKTVPEDAVDLEALGAKAVIAEGNLETYGINASSIPAKIDGATYYKFGVYPQTIKADSIDVDETIINLLFDTVDYYLGSDNNWYAKCLENACVECGELKYSDGTTTVAQASAESYKYFKVEPIVWRQLGNTKCLLAEKELTANVPYYGSYDDRTLGDTTISANNYKYSNIRAWLNGTQNQFVAEGGTPDEYTIDWSGKGFLQTAFTEKQRAQIDKTDVDNSAESTNDNTGSSLGGECVCENTQDKIFLLSVVEATTSDYGFDAYNVAPCPTKQRVLTDYAKANYAGEDDGKGMSWWLRSPIGGNKTYYAQSVYYNGQLLMAVTEVDTSYIGVVPALKLVEN